MNYLSKIIIILIILVIGFIGYFILVKNNISSTILPSLSSVSSQTATPTSPLNIEYMRSQTYPGSDITIEQTLTPGNGFNRYLASYQSEGLKIYALLLVPTGVRPVGGWPVIVFNHGYIPPEQYDPTQKYIAYENAFAGAGYIVFRPSYRGNGASQGTPTGAYYSPDYTIDDLNAIASIKKYPDANPDKIGVWGHSMGGAITLRDLVINSTDIKAAVIWGGVVGSYNDLINNWQSRVRYRPAPEDLRLRNNNRQNLMNQYGTPQSNPAFWNSIDPTAYLADITAPIQLDVGGADQEVPPDFSSTLYDKLTSLGKTAEFYSYPGSDHNISQGFNLAMKRTIAFFDKYLK